MNAEECPLFTSICFHGFLYDVLSVAGYSDTDMDLEVREFD